MPCSNCNNLDLSIISFSPRAEMISHRAVMCSFGITSSFSPLSSNIGIVSGMSWILETESHFWWQRKANGDMNGSSVGIKAGSVVNVFSRMSARILKKKN
jgi:hypothetical protein